MTLYETIFTRRQVRNYLNSPVPEDCLSDILACVSESEQLSGQHADFKLLPAAEVSANQGASHYLLAFCDSSPSAYANVGFLLQKADLYIQSMGLGSGYFMNIKPKNELKRFCIALAIGKADTPARTNESEFKRKPLNRISKEDTAVSRAVRLAPSSLNSQPWELKFEPGKIIVEDAGTGISRLILKNKLNEIDIGIAARHAVLALEHNGNAIISAVPKSDGSKFRIEITYKEVEK